MSKRKFNSVFFGVEDLLKDLFLNATTVIAFISLGNQILINQEIEPSSPFKLRFFFSSMAGLLGIILMVNSVQVMPGVILDFRNIAIILSSTYCGLAAAIITGLIIGAFRLIYAGISFASVVSAATVIVIAVGCGIIAKLVIYKLKKWVTMCLYTLIVASIIFSVLIADHLMLLKTLVAFWIGTSLVSALVYLYLSYLDVSKFTYRKYQVDSSTDHRTGLNNVRQFDNELNKIISGLRDDSVIAMFFIDIDFFKKVNDRYGHKNGDKVLEDLGKVLLSTCSHSDIVSRNGGEEFSVLLADCPREKILEVAERIRKAVQQHKFILFEGLAINITISIGVAIYPDTVKDINLIVENADSALYEAKRKGRNRVFLAV